LLITACCSAPEEFPVDYFGGIELLVPVQAVSDPD
jgi:hypothetical protein